MQNGLVHESLRGQLLIASPQLTDYFRRTIVLVIEHTDDGAMGIVLNRPSGHSIGESVAELAGMLGDQPLWVGGPVQPNAVVVLSLIHI